MSSAPGSFISQSTASGLHEAFQSYRRSQYFFTDTVSATPTDDEYDEESFLDEEWRDVERRSAEDTGELDETLNLVWEDLPSAPSSQPRSSYIPASRALPKRWSTDRTIVPSQKTPIPSPKTPVPSPRTLVPSPATPSAAREDTPLLLRTTLLSFAEPPTRTIDNALPSIAIPADGHVAIRRTSYSSIRPTERRKSNAIAPTRAAQVGKSTFGQTLFNAIAVLLGIGMLSEPLAFSYAGWIGGLALMIFYGYITCYTAKILAHFILDDPKLRSYTDIGRKAFGNRASALISTLFCLELFTVSVALVTLFGDTLHSVLPRFSSDAYKLMGLVIIVPTVLMPLSALSYASVIGIVSTIFLIVVMFIDGLSKTDGPGSLWSPADTNISPGNMGELGLAFGLFMAGFSGHAVIPSLAKDMVDPSQFDDMINWAFYIATFIYTTIGVTGYFMFGNSVSQEFSQDLMRTPGYNPWLNKATMWGLVLVPLSKFALATRPLSVTIEIILGIDAGSQSPDDHGVAIIPNTDNVSTKTNGRMALLQSLTIIERTFMTVLSVIVSIAIPGFDSVMAFLGSFSAFIICVIGPLLAKAKLVGRLTWYDYVIFAAAVVMAAWGTGAAFWSAA